MKLFSSSSRLISGYCIWLITASLSANMLNAQINSTHVEQELKRNREEVDCYVVNRNAIDDLIRQMSAARWDSVIETSAIWQKLCGRSQAGMRARILAFAHTNDTTTAPLLNYTRYYIYNHYYGTITYFSASNSTADRELRNYFRMAQFDSLISAKARDLQSSAELTANQNLVISSFSEGNRKVRKMLRSNPYRKSAVGQQLLKERYEAFQTAPMHFSLKIGAYRPFQHTQIISTSPVIGMNVISALDNPWIFHFEFAGNIHTGTREVDFVAFNDTNAVRSNGGLNISVGAGYKIWENRNAMLLLKNDVGLKMLTTNLTSENPNDDLSIETLMLRTGLQYNVRVLNHRRLGFELLYHYHPYQWDRNLLSPLGSNGLSLSAHFIF